MRRILLAALVAATGCAAITANNRNYEIQTKWDARVNSHAYSFKDAVTDYGPPTDRMPFDDGSFVAVWRWDAHGREKIHTSASAFGSGGYANGFATTSVPVTKTEELIATFNRDGMLAKYVYHPPE